MHIHIHIHIHILRLYCLSKVVSTSASKLRTDVGDGPNPTFSVHQTGISLPLPLRPLSVSDVVGLAGHPKHKNHSTHKLYDHLYAKGFMHEDGRGPVTRPAKNRDKHARQKEAKREGKVSQVEGKYEEDARFVEEIWV